MRIHASQQTKDWLDQVIDYAIINKIPYDSNYQIKVFTNPKEMKKEIRKKNENLDNCISRMVSAFDWKYSDGKELPKDKYWMVFEGDWQMPWNYEINKRDKYEKNILLLNIRIYLGPKKIIQLTKLVQLILSKVLI